MINQQSMYPKINFICNGSITVLYALARRFNGSDNMDRYPELQVWRKVGDENYTKVDNITLNGENINKHEYESINEHDIIELHHQDSPLDFQAGDIFGLFQPSPQRSQLRIYSQRQGGPMSLYMGAMGDVVPCSHLNYSSFDVFNDYPLVSVTTGQWLPLLLVYMILLQ